MNLLEKRIEVIKEALRNKDLKQGASLLISTLASDDLFLHWERCSQGSERVPKILKYIREIRFDEDLPTACIDLVKGRLKLGVGFFLDQIQGPEDFLFILIHERNHLILGKLYPEINPGNGYPKDLFNFSQDGYINAIGRRTLASTLPERFYQNPLEMVLTGWHSRIDWSGYRIKGNSDLVKEAHQGIYRMNYSLMQALGERVEGSGIPGYREWMEIMAEWYQTSRSQETNQKGWEFDDQATPPPSQESCDQASSGLETEDGGGEKGADRKEAREEERETSQGREVSPGQTSPDKKGEGREEATILDPGVSDPPPQAETTNPKAAPPFAWKPEPGEIEEVVKSYTPLIETPPDKPVSVSGQGGMGRDENGLKLIPIPGLKPDDLVVQLILETSDLSEFRDQVRGYMGEALQGVEKAIRGILSDQAIEQAYQGYSLQVPTLISRKNLLSLSLGDYPVIWDKVYQLKAPRIDLYVDVSGSMNLYYGYIPYIYDALRGMRGRIFQFSTEVVETDPDDQWLHTTGGTDFDQVAAHILAKGTRSLLLVSDGHGGLEKTNLRALARQVEGLIYLKVRENDDWNWEEVASQTIILNKGSG